MPSASAVSTSSSKTLGERVEPRPIAGPEPKRVAADLLLVDPGRVGGVGDVDGDRDVGAELEGGGAGAEEADLLLHGGDGGHRAAGPVALGAAAQALQRDVGAEAVVHRAGDEPLAGDRHRLGGDHHRVADPDQLRGLLAVGGADVDVHALQLDDLFALVGLEQVDRLAPGDAGHEAVLAADLDPLADEDLRVPAADRREPEEALLVDVGDDQADLVDVADDRQQRRGLADAGDRGADAVDAELGEGGGLAPDLGGRALVSGGRAGAQKLVEEGWSGQKVRGVCLIDDVRRQLSRSLAQYLLRASSPPGP